MKISDMIAAVLVILALVAPASAQVLRSVDEPVTREERLLFDLERQSDRAEADRRYWESEREDTIRRSQPPALIFPPPPTVCTRVGLSLVCQ